MKQIGLSNLKKKIKKTYPNQYICEEKANGVMCNDNFYPVKFAMAATLPAKPGIRYYLRDCSLNLVIWTVKVSNPMIKYYITLPDASVKSLAYLSLAIMPAISMYANVQSWFRLGYLCDENQAVTFYVQNQDDGMAILYYSEIDVLPGNKQPKVIEE